MGLLSMIFGGGKRHDREDDKDEYVRRNDLDHLERENHQRWLDERSKDP